MTGERSGWLRPSVITPNLDAEQQSIVGDTLRNVIAQREAAFAESGARLTEFVTGITAQGVLLVVDKVWDKSTRKGYLVRHATLTALQAGDIH